MQRMNCANDVGELDPRVRVVETERQMGNYRNILQEVVDDLGLTLEQTIEIVRSLDDSAK